MSLIGKIPSQLVKQLNFKKISGGSILALLIAGYLAQRNGYVLPPKPKIAGVDLGTTFSSIGLYQAVTGETEIIADNLGKRSIPSVVGFL